jgi:hypothetical protein
MTDDEIDDLAVTAVAILTFVFFCAGLGAFVWWAVT